MNAKRQRRFQATNKRQMMAVLLGGLFLTVLALAQFETLHRFFHPDAAKPNHQCAVTMLQSGQVDAPACDVAVAAVAPVLVTVQFVADAFVSSVDYSLPPGRGPPAILS